MSDFEEKKVPEELIDSLKKKKCALFVGAGLSVGAGLPNWGSLLSELIEISVQRTNLKVQKQNELKKLAKDPSKYMLLAEELREILPNEIQKYIKDKFDNKLVKPTVIHKKTMKLPFRFIITTNYDCLLEHAYVDEWKELPNVFTYEDAASINYNIWNEEHFILKAHGDSRKDPGNIILTEKDYRKILYRKAGYQSVLHVIFSTYNILFLGFSLNDPEIKLLMGYIYSIFHGGSPTHFALINKKEMTNTEANRWRKDFNVQLISYDPVNNHEQVNQFLDFLLDKIS